MSSDVEIRITIRDGTATVGGAGIAAQSAQAGLPTPEPGMGSGDSAVSSMSAPSPVDGAGSMFGATADAPSPTSVGAFEGVAASGELPAPLPLDEVARLTGSGGSDAGSTSSSSDLPAPDDDQG